MVTIKVTDEHIKYGIPGSSRSCAVSLAIRDNLKSSRYDSNVSVSEEYIYVDRYIISMPREVQSFVSNFDYGRNVEPMEFQLDLP